MVAKVKIFETEKGRTPVADFISSLPRKEEAKVYREIDLLKKEGIYLGFPETSAITGYKPLRELRIRFGKNLVRIFYFLHIRNTFILLHGFKKKTGKTPVREIEIAYRRMKDYLSRNI